MRHKERERERERERESSSIWVCCGASFYTTHREREMERESVRREEEVHEEESLGGSVGERERDRSGAGKEKSSTPET